MVRKVLLNLKNYEVSLFILFYGVHNFLITRNYVFSLFFYKTLSQSLPAYSMHAHSLCPPRYYLCLQVSTSVLGNMDRSVDPCDNMYHFACGGYVNKTNLLSDEDGVDVANDIEISNLQVLKQVIILCVLSNTLT